MTLIYEDRLLSKWKTPNGTIVRGKRVARSCPLTYAERRVYVKESPARCVRTIMNGRGLSLVEAFTMLNVARGGSYRECKERFKNRWQRAGGFASDNRR